jgi:hypothetical protein
MRGMALSAIVPFLACTSGEAATISAYTQYGGNILCDSSSASAGTVTASCADFSAGDGMDGRASYGSVGLRAVARGPNANSARTAPVDHDSWRGGAVVNDTLFFGIEAGTFRLHYSLTATLIEDITGEFGGSSLPQGLVDFQAFVNDSTVFRRYHAHGNYSVYTMDHGAEGPGFVDLAFSGGSLDLSFGLYTDIYCGAMHSGTFENKVGTCSLGVDAWNSLSFAGGQVYDAFDAPVLSGFTSSESGFDYGIAPALVPLPASWVLLALGLGGLGTLRRGGQSSRASRALAAACSACRLALAVACALSPLPSRASMVKTGAWSGPARSITT